MNKVLVTGANGFAGQHLVEALVERDCKVVGLTYSNVLDQALRDLFEAHVICDLTDKSQVDALDLEGVTAIINLAGIAINNPDEQDVDRIINTNVRAHTNLYDRLVEIGSDARVIAVSSGAIYDPSGSMPLDETAKLTDQNAATPYVRSKLALEKELEKYEDNLDIFIARPFNHTGPGQQRGFLIPDWAEKLLGTEHTETLDVSRLNTCRDISDVRDVVNDYVDLAIIDRNRLKHRVYNICSGIPTFSYDAVKLLADGLCKDIAPAPERNESVIYGSRKRISQDTGRNPKIPKEQTMADFINWRLKQE